MESEKCAIEQCGSRTIETHLSYWWDDATSESRHSHTWGLASLCTAKSFIYLENKKNSNQAKEELNFLFELANDQF